MFLLSFFMNQSNGESLFSNFYVQLSNIAFFISFSLISYIGLSFVSRSNVAFNYDSIGKIYSKSGRDVTI